jgi:transposase
MRAQGYPRSRSNVARTVTQLRREGPPARAAGRRGTSGQNLSALTSKRGPSARQVAFLLLRRETDRGDEERVSLEALCEQDTALAQAMRLTDDFAQMLRERRGERLDAWLAEAAGCELAALQRLAVGFSDAAAAVRPGLTLPYSNGQLEGQVNRLKAIKRQMYRRAGFALLCQRVLHHEIA